MATKRYSSRSWQGADEQIKKLRGELERIGKPPKTRDTDIELRIRRVLDTLELPYEPHVRFGNYEVDILLLAPRLVIECDGEPWHSKPEKVEADKRRDQTLRRDYGLRTIRIPGRECRKITATELMQRIRRATR